MSEHTVSTSLSPLERLQLRDSLQDRWRDQVERITELSVDLHTALDDQRDVTVELVDTTAIATALSAARLRLVEIEQAMQRLDDRTFGRCSACLMPIGLEVLADLPESRHCAECRTAGTPSRVTAMAQAG